MTNTGQMATYQRRDLGETHVMNHDLVRDHIDDLFREGEALRAARTEAGHKTETHDQPKARPGPMRVARVRLGRWLVGVGSAVAGSSTDAHETTGGAV
jgi:hypothetical protein